MITDFARRLTDWQRCHGRHNLPWQVDDPYRIWLSEIMLQQTQVATVANYYPRFIAAFPDVATLAAAETDQVLALWQGLGYYSRARNLHKAAQQVMHDFGGQFPRSRQQLETLCGVGRSTAAAIAAFAYHQRETILDGNVKRVLCRVYGKSGNPSDKAFEQSLWQLAESLLPTHANDMPAYTQGLMDLGATICKRSKPLCNDCPMQHGCIALQTNRIAELPQKKTPIKISIMPMFWLLIQRDDGAILLEKRPEGGIWGGLFCLPSFDNNTALFTFASTLGINEIDIHQDTEFTHRLTHRTLQIHLFTLSHYPHLTPSLPAQFHWVRPADLAQYGIPKPLHRYLHTKNHSLFA